VCFQNGEFTLHDVPHAVQIDWSMPISHAIAHRIECHPGDWDFCMPLNENWKTGRDTLCGLPNGLDVAQDGIQQGILLTPLQDEFTRISPSPRLPP
jgi:hypothetical protein